MRILIDVYTSDHIIRGNLNSPDERLSDILNIKNESAILLEDVLVTRLPNLNDIPPIKFLEARIEKRSILFACPEQRDITQKSMYRKAARLPYDVCVLVPGFEIIGTVHLTEKFDTRRVLVAHPDDFIPLTNAMARYVAYPALTVINSPIVFNKTLATFIGERLADEEPFGAPSSTGMQSD
jgi:hypothetical protein